MTSQHITRCNKEFGAFNGWRVCITRLQQTLVRYFSDLEYGGARQAQVAAQAYRDKVYTILSKHPGKEDLELRKLSEENRLQHNTPGNLHPARGMGMKRIRKAITLRVSPQLDTMLNKLSEHLGVDTSSVMRLALYSYLPIALEITENPTKEQLAEHLQQLEIKAKSRKLPGFAEMMLPTGK